MTTTLPRRAATVVVAVAVTAAGGSAALAADRISTSLSIRSTHSVVAPGGHDTISGSLRGAGHALTNRTVILESKPAGSSSFARVAAKKTGEHGGVAFVVTPTVRTAYELVFAGGPNARPSHSGIVTVDVRRPQSTSLSIRAARSPIDPGSSDTISGNLRSGGQPLANRTVWLLARTASDQPWSWVAHKATGSHGGVAFTVTPGRTTHYELAFREHEWYHASRSGVVTVVVRQPSALSVATSATSVDPGGSATISGVLTGAGSALAGRTVELQQRAPGASTWSKVASATTASDGSVSFTVSPAATTQYRLAFFRGYRFLGSRSAVVTVAVRRPSSLSIRAATASVAPGGSDTVSGTLLGAGGDQLAGRTVTLMSRPAGTDSWTSLASGKTGEHGFVAFTVSPAAATDYELVFAGGERYLACHSGVVTVTVA